MFKIRIVNRGDSLTIFNPNTGETIIDGNGNCDTPILLDVSLTNKCEFKCKYCYKHSSPTGKNMDFEDFKLLIEKMKEAQVFQVAYGGGNPNEHPYFIDVLKMTHEAGIVPNYSTNGTNLTKDIIDASAKYCGSVAVSIHRDIDSYFDLIPRLINKIKKVNLHFVMTHENTSRIVSFLKNPPQWSLGINAIVLLRYKKVIGSSEREPLDFEYKMIFESAEKSCFKIAFDACSYPLIKKYLPNVDEQLYDYCQGARSSAYINENLIMSPCSFDCQQNIENDLHKFSIKKIFTESMDFANRRNEVNDFYICKQYFDNFE